MYEFDQLLESFKRRLQKCSFGGHASTGRAVFVLFCALWFWHILAVVILRLVILPSYLLIAWKCKGQSNMKGESSHSHLKVCSLSRVFDALHDNQSIRTSFLFKSYSSSCASTRV